MKQKFCLLFSAAILLFSCNTNEGLPNTDMDVAREFIKDIQQSNFKRAEQLLLKDETNKQEFDRFEQHFKSKPKEELEQYKKADIIVNKMTNVNDSVTIINYSNDFNRNEKNNLKITRIDGQWLVDLKFTFQ
jgi:hypothetical protein